MSKDDLPSIEQFVNKDNLPSIEEFLTEQVEQELPSVENFIEKKEEEIQELNEEFVPEERSFELNEVLRLINDVRESIPDIPEIKYYDKELEDICESIQLIASAIPEVKYYDSDIERLQKDIQEVRSEIPVFPKWINEVNEVPDFSWIGKTFSVIDDDFVKVNDTIETLRERVEVNLREVVEENDTKRFETKVELQSKIKELDEKYQEVKDRIWKELRESSLKIWEYHKEFKDDDRKLKKQITNEYNSLKNNLEEKLKEFNENSVKTDQVLLNYFENLKEQISSLPEIKYYDEDIKHVRNDIKDLYDLVRTIKSEQKGLQEELQESLLREPPEEKESIGKDPDPLTPLDQKFATLEDLSNHYRIFINRIQTQLSTMGGGGAGFIKDLDDVSFDQTTGDGKLLIYNGSQWVGIASESLGGSVGAGGTWQVDSVGIHTTKNVGVGTTARSEYKLYVDGDALFTGNVSVAGTITYEDVTNVDSIGIITARNSAIIKAGTATTALIVEGDARVVGILTIGTSSITLDGSINQVNVGSGVTIHHTNGVQVGGNTLHTSGLTLNHVTISGVSTISQLNIENGITISGVVTSSSFVKSGGTSSQFLKADGSIDSNTYLTSYTETDTLSSVTERGNSTSTGLNISGVTTSHGGFVGNLTGTATTAIYASSSGISTYSTNAGIATISQGLTGSPSITVSSVNSSGIVTASSYSLPDGLISSGVSTTNTISETAIDSFSSSLYRSSKYQIQITRGSEYQSSEIFVIHDGTITHQTEYAIIKTGNTLGTFSTDITTGNIRLLVTPSSTDQTTFKFVKTLIEV